MKTAANNQGTEIKECGNCAGRGVRQPEGFEPMTITCEKCGGSGQIEVAIIPKKDWTPDPNSPRAKRNQAIRWEADADLVNNLGTEKARAIMGEERFLSVRVAILDAQVEEDCLAEQLI